MGAIAITMRGAQSAATGTSMTQHTHTYSVFVYGCSPHRQQDLLLQPG